MNNLLPALLLSFLALNASAGEPSAKLAGPAVKKSASGICHEQSSRFYGQLKRFTPFESLKACLDSGGHVPAKKAKA